MLKKFTTFIKHPTSIHVLINTLGNYLNTAFTALFALILVRIMTPVEYGVLGVLLGISYVLANVFDFGTTATIYSYFPQLKEKEHPSTLAFLKTLFLFQTVFACAAIIILAFSFQWLDSVFFKTGSDVPTTAALFAGVLLFIWQNFATNVLLAAKQFMKVNIYVNLSNIVKLLGLVYLWYTTQVSPYSVLVLFGVVGSFGFIVPMVLEKWSSLERVWSSSIDRSILKLRYTITYFASMQLYNLAQRMDLFLLSYFGLKHELGYYTLAQKIALTIATFSVSVTQVLSPLFARVQRQTDVKKLLRPSMLYLSIPAVMYLLLSFTPDWIFQLFFTEKFIIASRIARQLALPYIIFTYENMLFLFTLYTIRQPKYMLVTNLLFFLGMTGGCLTLIPRIGIQGPVWTLTGTVILSSLVLLSITTYEYKKLPR